MSAARRFLSLSLVGLATAGLVGITAERSQAFDGTFQATAAASGARVSIVVPHAPLSDRVADFGGPTAETVVDSIGESSAFASFPFPGAGPATSPALIRGASGGQLPVPDYPMFVSSKAPANPKQEFGAGPYAISAQSAERSSVASATVGLDGGGGTALGLSKSRAESGAKGESVVATATSETTGFSAGPLRIARVLSNASTTFNPDGTLARVANTVVEGASVGGTPVNLATPDLSAVNQLLASAKIQVDFAPKQEVDTGVSAPMLRITQRDDSSGATIVYQIGEASAFVDAALPPSAGAAGSSAVSSDETSASAPGTGSATEPSSFSPEATAPVTASAPASNAAVAESVGVPVAAPVTFVLPSAEAQPAEQPVAEAPASLAAPAASNAAPAPQTVELAGASRAAGMSPAARLLFNRSDTGSVFLILIIGAAAGLGVTGLLGRVRAARG